MSPRSQVTMIRPKCGRYGCSVGKTRPPKPRCSWASCSLARVKKSPRVAAVPVRLLGRSAFRDPVVPLVAVEEIVGAERDRRGSTALEIKKRRAMPGRRARAVERADARAHRSDAAAQQADDLDLMRELIEGDAPAPLGVELIGPMRPEKEIVVVEAQDHAEPAHFSALDDPAHLADIRIEGMGMADDQPAFRSSRQRR